MDISILLSAGVIVSLITGVFSLIVSVNNNKKMLSLEKYKQQSIINQERYKHLSAILDKLLNQTSILDNIPNNPQEVTSEHIVATHLFAEKRFNELKKMYNEFSFMLSTSHTSTISTLIEEIDNVTHKLKLGVDNNSKNVDPDDDLSKRTKLIIELNKKMIDTVKTQLEEIMNT